MRRTLSNEKTGLKKGPWTPEEDEKLVDYIRKHGPGNWRHLPDKAGLQRCGKSCRLRWTNYLRPDIKRGRFSSEEEEFIIQLHSVVGNKWSAIAAKLPGRTDNEIKNYWNTHIRKKLLEMGIDPVTHGPRLDLLDFTSILTSLNHTSSSPNILTLLNLQTLLNPQLPNLATTPLTSSQNEILTNTSFLSKTLTNAHLLNQIDSQVQNYSTFDKPNMAENPSKVSSTETYHSWFLETKHVNAKLNHNSYAQDDHGSIHPNESNPSFINNYGGVSLDFSSPCSSLAHPLDASHIYLNSSPCIEEEEEEIDCFFNNILNKLDPDKIC